MTMRRISLSMAAVSFLSLTGILSLTSHAAGPDASAGKDVFSKRCAGCHAADSDKEGPHLRGVFGRKAGSVPGFQYSDALRNSALIWDETLLTRWLENPQALVRDNDMEFRVANASEREAVIAYLKSLAPATR